MAKKPASEYFSFTRKERTGIIVIVLVILLLTGLPLLFPYLLPERKQVNPDFEKTISGLTIRQSDSTQHPNRYYGRNTSGGKTWNETNQYQTSRPAELFYFDPNTITAEGWQRLGLRDKAIQTIQHYLSKGGSFKKPEDIGKVWGLSENDVKRLLPFVSIKNKDAGNPQRIRDSAVFTRPVYEKKLITIDINTADSTVFIALPGIGSRLANRIIAFREKLGGFYNIDQLAETFALPDSVFQKIRNRLFIGNVPVKKININTAGIDELKAHPYIRYALGNALLQYRNTHGTFADIADIKKIMIVTEPLYAKLAPYLTVQ